MLVSLSVAMPLFGLILTGAVAGRFGLLSREVASTSGAVLISTIASFVTLSALLAILA